MQRAILLGTVSATAMALVFASAPARAQAPDQTVMNLNREAMEAYNALDIEKAGSTLERALQTGYQNGASPPVLARTHVNLGVVYVGGLGDRDAGLNAFVQALCLDASVQLDPLTSTPDIQNVFNVAVQRARGGACAGGPPPGGPPGPPGPVGPPMVPPPQAVAPPPPPPPPPPDQAFLHQAPLEQQSQTPLPIYAEIHPLARAHNIWLMYRSTGMDDFKRVPMYRFQSGFAQQISCNDVWEPKVTYYLEARDEDDRVVGTAGTALRPIEVPVVAKLTQAAPSLPGTPAPASCATKECPPGMKGCDKRPGSKAAIGQDCDADADCQSGLECTSDGCMIIGAGGTEVPEFDPQTGGFVETEEPERDEPGEFNPTFVQLGFTVGLAYLQAGMVADRPAPENRVFINELNQYVEDPFSAAMMGTRLFFPEPGTPSETQVTAWVPDADSADANGPLEGNCSADGEVTDPALYAMSVAAGTPNPDLVLPSRYCVRVKNPGFVPNIALRAAIGHFITPEISLAAVLRFQFSAGEGTLPNMLIGARGEYLLTAPKSRGLMISAFAGATFGEIQAQPPADGETEGAPYVRSGLFGMHVGATFRYRLSPSFGFFAAPEVDIQLPTTLFNVDLTLAGLEAAF